jgi:hypothetical protein
MQFSYTKYPTIPDIEKAQTTIIVVIIPGTELVARSAKGTGEKNLPGWLENPVRTSGESGLHAVTPYYQCLGHCLDSSLFHLGHCQLKIRDNPKCQNNAFKHSLTEVQCF